MILWLITALQTTNYDKNIIKVLNKKHAEKIMISKSNLKGINFPGISNTSNSIDKEVSVNLPKTLKEEMPEFFINYSFMSLLQVFI